MPSRLLTMSPSLRHQTKFAALVLFFCLTGLVPLSLILILSEKTILLDWSIIYINSCSINIRFILDPVGCLFACLVIFISMCVMLFTTSYILHDPFLSRFVWLVILFVISINFLIFIPNLIAILLGWDGLGLVSFLLVIYYQNSKSLRAGILTVLANRIGDVIILIRIAWALSQGHWHILFFHQTSLRASITIAILIAAITKRAQIPFSRWLPAAIAAPTPVSALVHSSTLVTAGVFLLVRFFPFLNKSAAFAPSLLCIATLTMFMAGISATFESDLKKVIALSTLRQLGVIIAALGLGLVNLTLFHLFTHALFKALLFLCAGNIIHQSINNQDLRIIGNLWAQLPLSVSCLNTANLALIGTPFLAAFYSKDAILETAARGPTNFIIILILILATGITATYSFRLAFLSLWGPQNSAPTHAVIDNDKYITFPMILLTLGAVSGGAVISWLFLPTVLEPVIPFFLKISTLVVTLTGAWLAVALSSSSRAPSFSQKIVLHSSSTIWFIGLISTQPIIKIPLIIGHTLLKTLDHGWWELFAGQGLFSSTKTVFQSIQPIQATPLTTLITIVLSVVGLTCILLFIYFGSL